MNYIYNFLGTAGLIFFIHFTNDNMLVFIVIFNRLIAEYFTGETVVAASLYLSHTIVLFTSLQSLHFMDFIHCNCA